MLLEVDDTTVPLVLEALRSEATRRQRAATRAAGELQREQVKDPRPASVRIVRLLGEADTLESFARHLEAAHDQAPSHPPAETTVESTEAVTVEDDPAIPPSVADPDEEVLDAEVPEAPA